MMLAIVDHFDTAQREYRIVVDEHEFANQDQLRTDIVELFQRALADMTNFSEVRA